MNRLTNLRQNRARWGACRANRRKMRAAATKAARCVANFQVCPALCLLAVCILIFALPESGNPAPTCGDDAGSHHVFVDPLYDEMRQNSGARRL